MKFPLLAILLPFIHASVAHRFCAQGGTGVFLLYHARLRAVHRVKERCKIKGVGASMLVKKCWILKYSKPEVSCLENRYDVSNDADCFPLELLTV